MDIEYNFSYFKNMIDAAESFQKAHELEKTKELMEKLAEGILNVNSVPDLSELLVQYK